jgi:hypothetical protein
MLELTDFGAKADGSDCTPALNAALAAASGPTRTIHIPAGEWAFLTQPNVFTMSQRLIGEGKHVTYLTFGLSNSHFIQMQSSGAGLRELSLLAGAGTSGSVALRGFTSDDPAIGAGGNHVIEDVWITSKVGATWAIPLFLDGAARTIAPAGIRTVALRNVTVFNATLWAVEWWNTIACEWYGGGAYQGAGTTQSLAIGGPLATENLIHADLPGAPTSTVAPGALRSPVQ